MEISPKYWQAQPRLNLCFAIFLTPSPVSPFCITLSKLLPVSHTLPSNAHLQMFMLKSPLSRKTAHLLQRTNFYVSFPKTLSSSVISPPRSFLGHSLPTQFLRPISELHVHSANNWWSTINWQNLYSHGVLGMSTIKEYRTVYMHLCMCLSPCRNVPEWQGPHSMRISFLNAYRNAFCIFLTDT